MHSELDINTTGSRRGSFSDVLLKRGFLKADDLDEVQRHAMDSGLPLEKFVLQERLITQDKFAIAAAEYFAIPPISIPENFVPPSDLLEVQPADFWIRVKALPLAKKIAEAVRKVTGAEGINILQNNGEAAGQTVKHFHIHIIPRFSGDHVFEQWVPGTSVPEEQADLCAKIASLL